MAQFIKQVPPAKSLIAGIRSIGYNFSTSVADILDNSIAAKADTIRIFSDPLATIPYFCIIDNGMGMDFEEIKNAMTFGSDRGNKSDDIMDLGRFGLGLKSASLSQCRKLTVISKKNNKINGMSYDLDIIDEKNDWILNVLEMGEILNIPRFSILEEYESGTLVLWENFDKIEQFAKRFEDSFRVCVDEAKKHVELVFHRFYEQLTIYFNEVRIEKRDPFLLDSAPRQQTGRTDYIDMKGEKISVTPYVLPFANTLTKEEKNLLGNPKSIYDEQGFYIYRNRRLIIAGKWLHMHIKSELSKLARVQIDIPSNLDIEWSLDVKKSTAKIPDKIRDQIKAAIEDSVIRSKKTTRCPGVKEQSYEERIWYRTLLRDKDVKYEINRNNPLYKELYTKMSEEDKTLLETLISQIEEGLPKYSIQNDTIEDRNIVNNTDSRTQNELKQELVFLLRLIEDEEQKKKMLDNLLRYDIYQSIVEIKEEIMKEACLHE